MNEESARRGVLVTLAAVLSVGLVTLGVWVAVDRGGPPAPAPPAASGSSTQTPTAPGTSGAGPVLPATTTVTVYFHADSGLIPVRRTVPRTSMVATAALRQLLAGPTARERAAGIWSAFSGRTAGMLRSVRIAGGVGYADFADLRTVIPNASSSAGSEAMLAELDATFRQFAAVRGTVYALKGDVEAFYLWLQRVPPTTGAAAAARDFATGVLGMVRPVVTAPQRQPDGSVLATVESRAGRDGQPLLGTQVTLRRAGMSWSVTGARSPAVHATSPQPGQAVSSPVYVAAQLRPFIPGVAEVRVVQVVGGTATVLGRSGLYGQPELFSADVSYRRPAVSSGWVLVVERAVEADGQVRQGEVVGGDAIRVRFVAAARPVISGVTTLPTALPVRHGAWVLPDGAGTVGFNAQVHGRVDRVEFSLVPAGSDGWSRRVRLPVDGTAGHPWNATLTYRDEPLSAQLVVIAIGPGGQTRYSHPVVHP
ncbi:MAG TPA: GerMN domain-containing protein [Mycobacteriales bacterium]|nr:GerMN domain-containing protein [Mycobacteriales bacterium]